MSQYGSEFQSPYEGQYGDPYAEPPKTSALAVASLVCSLLICCPLLTILGPILGLSAIVSISANPESRKGKGLAFSGIIIGLIVTILWGVGIWFVASETAKFMNLVQIEAPAAVQAGFADDPGQFRAAFSGPAATASDAEVQAFVDELRARYGDFGSLQLSDRGASTSSPVGQAEVPVPMIMRFDQGAVDATMTVVRTPSGEWKLGSITVHDPDDGDITFPSDQSP